MVEQESEALVRAPAVNPLGRLRLPTPSGWQDIILYAAFVAVCVFFTFATPYFFTWQNAEIILIESATLAIVACGVTFVIIAADIDLSIGSMYALAGTLAAYLMTNMNVPWPLAAAAVLGVGVLLGLTNGVLSVFGGIPSFLVTLGTLGVVRGIDLMLTGTAAIPIYEGDFNSFFAAPVFGFSRPIFWAILVAVVTAVVLSRTIFGRHVYAVGGDYETSRLAGIPVGRIRISNFVLAGFLAALAGLIVAGRIQTGQPTIGTGLELDVVTAVILGGTNLFGGRGHIFGTIVGAVMITAIGNGLLLLGADVNAQTIFKGAILIVVVLARRLAGAKDGP
ncbi:MAG: ribose transport system permease protein [Gaiellaceae bacterium]|jgi:ribose transport system permease protein|nr:ribose transport system permease protein [Gaiellaceae bacterium]